jgi:hypothetical protein
MFLCGIVDGRHQRVSAHWLEDEGCGPKGRGTGRDALVVTCSDHDGRDADTKVE